MYLSLKDKVVVLTGASGGIGRAIATALDEQGAQLVLVARNQGRLRSLCEELRGKRHQIVAADLASDSGRDDLVALCRQFDTGIDLLINNAGINAFSMFEKQSQNDIKTLLEVNLLSPILVCHDLLPFLQLRRTSGIVNIGSTFGAIGYPGFSSYCASKFGLRGFTEALRRELTDSSTAVSYIAPRATRTAINSRQVIAMNEELGTAMDDPRTVAAEVLHIIRSSTQADEYIGWPEKLFARVNAVLPGLVDRTLRKQLPVIRRFAGLG